VPRSRTAATRTSLAAIRESGDDAAVPNPLTSQAEATAVPVVVSTTNGFAVASMVLGIVWLFWLGSLLAVVFGHIARSQIERSGVSAGNGMALAGLVLGYGAFALLILTLMSGGTVSFHVHL